MTVLYTLYLAFFTQTHHYKTWEHAVEFCMTLEEPCLDIVKTDTGYYRAIYERPFWK